MIAHMHLLLFNLAIIQVRCGFSSQTSGPNASHVFVGLSVCIILSSEGLMLEICILRLKPRDIRLPAVVQIRYLIH